ncbi:MULTISPECIES: hypothetical protein [Streptomyces]|uniref:Uncharacterized protein n=1 Tax=Streptomyces lichenis TaxID=2306967 RepID=A0ABT0I581_9ACTN|nr:hypothetical protein [Streptomyces lichenis]MCK8676486.1 hypothetical protein [Streptomyces lichenis]
MAMKGGSTTQPTAGDVSLVHDPAADVPVAAGRPDSVIFHLGDERHIEAWYDQGEEVLKFSARGSGTVAVLAADESPFLALTVLSRL